MDEQGIVPRRGGNNLSLRWHIAPSTAEFYKEGDPRLRLTDAQTRALRSAIRGDDLAAIARAAGFPPSRVRRWLKSPIFLKAMAAEAAQPTETQFSYQIAMFGVEKANTSARQRASQAEEESHDDE